MIAPDAEPIDNRNPYKRIDLAAKPKREVKNYMLLCPHCGTVYGTPHNCPSCNMYGG